jgi:putative ABC transport system permease protein
MQTTQAIVERIAQDVRYSARSLRQSPVFSLTTIVVVALGIAASTTIFAVVNAWLLRPLPLERPAELVSVWRTAAAKPREPAYFGFYRDYLVWAAENRSMAGLAAMFEQDYALTDAGEPRRVQGAIATWNLFAVVGGRPVTGRLFDASDVRGEPSCVISYALWRSQFGASPDTVGRIVRLNDQPYRVLGVLPSGFSLRILDRPFDPGVWTLIVAGDETHTPLSPTPVAVVGRLKAGVSATDAQTDLGAIQEQLNRRYSDEPTGSGVLVAGLQHDNTRTVRSTLLVLMAAVAVLLLIAGVNAGGLILGRHVERTREFAIRFALGCNVSRLWQLLTVDVLLLFACGGILGVAIASVLLRLFTASNPLGVLPPGGISVDGTVLATTGAAICATALLFGSVPAVRGLRRLDADVLRSRAATPDRSQLRSRMWFVALEIALSVVLLVSAGLLIATFANIASEPLGFETRGVYVTDVALPAARYATVEAQARFADRLLARLRALPSVRAAAVSASWPFQANGLSPIEVEGRSMPVEQAPHAFTFTVGPRYFDALGIPVLRGREFAATDDPRGVGVAVINDAMARRAFPGADPIGQRVRVRRDDRNQPARPWLTIVGVVSNTRSQRYNHIDWDQEAAVYTAFDQRPDGNPAARRSDTQTVYIYVRAQSVAAASVTAAVHAVDRDLPLGPLRTSDDIVNALRTQPRMRAAVIGGFALLTVVLALVGVYGVMRQFVELRRREIAIRIALGASKGHVVRVMISRALAVVIGGLTVGVLGAIAAGRLLNSMLYGVSAVDPFTFGAVVATLAAVSIVASYLPARWAAGIDPNISLKCD